MTSEPCLLKCRSLFKVYHILGYGTLMHRLEQTLMCNRQLPHTRSHRIVDGVGYGRAYWHNRWLAHPFRAKGTKRGWYLNQDGRNARHVQAERQRIIHQCRGKRLAVLIVNQSLKER